MKNILLVLFLVFFGLSQAQTVNFHEDFETLPLDVVSTGSTNWARSSSLAKSGIYCDSASIITNGDTAYLTTNTFSTSGNSYIMLKFNQICKLHFMDGGYIEVSDDNGATWTRLIGGSYIGNGQFANFGNKFSTFSYPLLWDAANNSSIPQNSWWIGEIFDLSSVLANKSQAKIRFVIADINNNGSQNNYGWLIDDIEVLVSNTEIIPPSIALLNPHPSDTILYSGPYDISAVITDSSGINTASIVYEIAGIYDTIAMNKVAANTYKGTIPSQPYNTDVRYHILATDSSINNNSASYPINNSIFFHSVRDPNLPMPLKYDANMHSVVSPMEYIYTSISYPVSLRISNKGDTLLTKAQVGWELDGVSQANYSWNGSLSLDQVSDTFNVANKFFIQGNHNITAWTYSPNDSLDQDQSNDTLSYSFFACNEILHGSYTLGGPSADFSDFTELIYVLNNCGMYAPTTIYVNPGIYNEQLYFNGSINGLDSINTLTIQSASTNVDDVIIKNSSVSPSDFVLGFDSVSYISIKGISVKTEGTATVSAISIINQSNNIEIESCKIIAQKGDNTTTYAIYAYGPDLDYISITNNSIIGGNYGIYLKGLSNKLQNHSLVKNNSIVNANNFSIATYYQEQLIIEGNKISRPYSLVAQSYITGIKLFNVLDYSVKNNIVDVNLNSSGYGISVVQSSKNTNGFADIINNMISVNGNSTSSTVKGIDFMSNTSCSIYNNSVSLNTGGSLSTAISIGGSSTDVNIKNNIFANYGGGYALTNSITNIGFVDYNNYYSNGINITKWGASVVLTSMGITAIRTASSQDTSSLAVDPNYYTNSNLHSYSSDINSAGTVISSITHDIDGDIRSSVTPDIGADEFSISSVDIGVPTILNVLPIDTQARVVDLQAIVKNYGSGIITSFAVNYSLNGASDVSQTWTGSLVPGSSDTVSLGNITLPVSNYSLNVYTVLSTDTLNNNDTLESQLFTLPLIEIEPIAMIDPTISCSKGNSEVVSILIANNGVSSVYNGITASYKLVGGSFVTESITDTIAAGGTLVYTFTQTANLIAGAQDSTFNFIFAVSHNSDPYKLNDSLNASVISKADLPAPIVSDTNISYGSSASLTAISNNPIFWYANDSTTVNLGNGANYITPPLFDTTTYYVQASDYIPTTEATVGFGTTYAGAFDVTIYGRTQGAGKYQILYTAAELSASGLSAGQIESIEFHVASTGSNYNLNDFSISMGNVTNTSLSSNFISSGLTNVYSSAFSGVNGADTWHTHTLTTPFFWDGTSNLLIQICTQGSVYNAPKVLYTTTTTNYFTVVQGSVNCNTTTGNMSSKRPNIKIKTLGSNGCVSVKVPLIVDVPLPTIDANLSAITKPMNGCGLISTPVNIEIINNGTDTIPGGYTATYKLGNNAYINADTIATAIAPADTLVYTFNTLASLAPGSNGTYYKITAKLFVPNDSYSANDSIVADSILSNYTPSNPTTLSSTVNYSNSAVLLATAIDSIFWYSDSLGSQFLGTGNGLITDPVYDTTTFYAQEQRSIAQSDYTIGTLLTYTGNTGPSPYGAGNYGAKMQFLITAAELSALGMMQGPIHSLSFNVLFPIGSPLNNYTIKIANTTKTSMLGAYLEGGLTTVYSESNYVDVSGWNEHQFITPYFWDGHSNLIIETCFKNTTSTNFASVYYTQTSDISVAYNIGDNSFSCIDSTITGNSTHRPNIRLNQTGLATCASDLVPLVVNVFDIPNTDAALNSIAEPSGIVSSIMPTSVKVVLKNYGLSNLTSATINWTEKGVNQTPFMWTGNLSKNQIDTVTIATNHLFKGGSTNIVAWVELNNDTIHVNDTVSMHKLICMSGDYSINSTNGEYLSFSDAAADLNLVGICGPVVFNVDSGTYSEIVTLYPIVGSSATNTITFQSTQLDSTAVILTNPNPTISNNYIIRLIGTSYVNIKHLSIKYSGSQAGNIIVLENGANNIEIRNNLILNGYTSSTTANACGVFANNHSINNVLINNNKFIGGHSSIYFSGSSSKQNNDISLINNTISGYYANGIKIMNSNSIIVSSNIITSATQGANVYGVYLNVVNDFDISNNKIITTASDQSYGMYLRGNGTSNNHSVISNNFSSTFGSSAINNGIYIYLSNYVDIVYNSINVNEGSISSKGLYVNGGSYILAKNNSIATEVGYSIYVPFVLSNYSFDYNNIYSNPNNGSSYVYWGTIISDLNLLKTADVNNNQHSVSSIPDYTSLTNLHAQGIDLYNAGIPISGISMDIDNDLRNTTTPCIGADEFIPLPIDINLKELVYPYESSCSYSATDSIVVNIKNMGLNTLNFSNTNATINIYISGISTDTITYILNTGNLTSGSEMNVKVSNSYDMSFNGMYTFNGSISMANDGNSINDIMSQISIVTYPNINSFPFSENFETGYNLSFKESTGAQSSIGITSAASNAASTSLYLCGGSNIGWGAASTVSQAFNNTSHVATVSSCNVDASSVTDLNLQFKLRQTKKSTYYNSSWFRVLLTDANSNIHYLKNLNGDSVFTPATVSSDPFQTQTYDLSMYVGQNFEISFESSCKYYLGYGGSYGDCAYIDDVIIWEPAPRDIVVKSAWSNSLFGLPGTNMVIGTSFSNMGLDTLYSIPLAYQVNNGLIVRDTAIGTFIPYQVDTFMFISNYSLVSGVQDLCVFAELPNDAVATNDTACIQLKGLSTFISNYSDDFEVNDEWFSINTNVQWQLGTPNSSFITTAHSGQNAWTTILNGNHATNTEDYLYSPYLIIPANADTALLEFWMTMNVNTLDVYCWIEYSFDGNLWLPIGYYGDPNSNNWYNKAINGKHVWSFSNYAWDESNIKLDPSTFNNGNRFQLRFVFDSGTNLFSNDGWAIDDFKITIPPMQTDAGVESIINPVDTTTTGDITTVSVKIKNYGIDTLTSIPVIYSINGGVISSETWNGVLPLDSSVVYTFTTTYTSSGNNYRLCAYTDVNNDMVDYNDSTCAQIISKAGDQDAGISSIITPYGQTTIGQSTQVRVMIQNYGYDTLYSVPVEYLINGNSKAIETFTGTIAPFDSAAYTFTTTYTSVAGTYFVCANTQLNNDVNPINDEICSTIIGTGVDGAKEGSFTVSQNRPNPAKDNTEIEFYLPKPGSVEFKIVNMLGATMQEQHQHYSQGKKIIKLSPINYAEGIYFYSISFDGEVKTFKMIIVR